MFDIIKKVIKYQETNDELIFESLISDFDLLIKKYVNIVNKKDQEDIYQELLMKLFKIVKHFKIKNYQVDDIYYKNFRNTIKDKSESQLEYVLFCNQNQFLKYLKVTFQNTINSYFRKQQENFIFDTIDDIDQIEDYNGFMQQNFKNTIEETSLSLKDKEFLSLFIEDDRILTEQEVALKLKITQQAVNKRKNKILKKLNRLLKLIFLRVYKWEVKK